MGCRTSTGRYNETAQKKMITAWVDKPIHSAMEQIAKGASGGVSAFIREAVREKLERTMHSGEGESATVVG